MEPIAEEPKLIKSSEDVEMKDEESKAEPTLQPAAEPQTNTDEWEKIKRQNAILNTNLIRTDVDATLKNQDLAIPFESDGTLQFFWIDAHEE